MKKEISTLLTIVFVIGMLLSSCSAPAETSVASEEIAVMSETEAIQESDVLETSTEPVEVTEAATEEIQSTEQGPTEVSEIVHVDIPGEPVFTQSLPGECNSGFNVENGTFSVKAPCDNWSINLLERPVSSDLSQFYHYLDILDAKAGQSEDWLYFQIDLFGAGFPDDGTPFTYYFELDTDQDGRGDYLIAVTDLDLYTTEWSVAGVQVFEDQNGDVGGGTAIRPDGSSNGNGYDTLLFDQGLGDDPDLAWARHNPNHYAQIEFAVKKSLIGSRTNLMWWAGAMLDSFNAQSFDLVDSASTDSLFPIDTTCGWFLGQETSYNIRKCYIAPEPTAGPIRSNQPVEDVCIQPPKPSPDPCWIWFEEDCEWVCYN